MIRHEITFRYTKNNLCITNRLSTICHVILVFGGNRTITDVGWISFDPDTEQLQAVQHLSPPKIIFVFKRAAFYSSENDIKWPFTDLWSEVLKDSWPKHHLQIDVTYLQLVKNWHFTCFTEWNQLTWFWLTFDLTLLQAQWCSSWQLWWPISKNIHLNWGGRILMWPLTDLIWPSKIS